VSGRGNTGCIQGEGKGGHQGQGGGEVRPGSGKAMELRANKE
jgi:hypothetical protein